MNKSRSFSFAIFHTIQQHTTEHTHTHTHTHTFVKIQAERLGVRTAASGPCSEVSEAREGRVSPGLQRSKWCENHCVSENDANQGEKEGDCVCVSACVFVYVCVCKHNITTHTHTKHKYTNTTHMQAITFLGKTGASCCAKRARCWPGSWATCPPAMRPEQTSCCC